MSLETYISGVPLSKVEPKGVPLEGQSRDGNRRNFLVRPSFEELLGALERSWRGLHAYGIGLYLWSRSESLNCRGQLSCPSIGLARETSVSANEPYCLWERRDGWS